MAETVEQEAQVPYQEAARRLLRDTLLDAARRQLESRTWSEVTMAEVAGAAGLSRQTLYREFGSRDEFAQAFVIREAEHFLDAVEHSVRSHADDPRAAIKAAFGAFLSAAGDDPLIRTLLSDDGTGGMLPFVTTQGTPVVHWASERLGAVIASSWPEAPVEEIRVLAESLVRLAISYITTPNGSPETTAASVTALLGPYVNRVLAESTAPFA